jgi:hypothetical protein
MATKTKTRSLRHKAALVLTWLGPGMYAVKLLVRWLIHAVNLGDNVKSIISFLNGVVHAGDVNLWDIGALAVVIVAAIIITLFLQKLGPFKGLRAAASITSERTTADAAQAATFAEETVKRTLSADLYGPRGKTTATGIAIIRNLNLSATVEYVECQCWVAFIGFSPKVTASPKKLRLTWRGEREIIMDLEASRLAAATGANSTEGITEYHGRAYVDARTMLTRAIRQEMGQDFKVTWPPSQPTFCEIEVRLLPEDQDHRDSGVKMDLELDLPDAVRHLLVRIR